MKKATIAESPRRVNLIAMSVIELENWFAALDFPVEVVANCGEGSCPDCRTVEPARAA